MICIAFLYNSTVPIYVQYPFLFFRIFLHWQVTNKLIFLYYLIVFPICLSLQQVIGKLVIGLFIFVVQKTTNLGEIQAPPIPPPP